MSRMPAFREAHDALLARANSGRVRRRDRYELLLPPKAVSSCRRVQGIVFLPGAAVDHVAYAPVAALLSDEGIVVALLNLEPFRLAARTLGASIAEVEGIMKDAEDDLKNETAYGGAEIRDKYVEVDWSIVGHSMGGERAYELIEEGLSVSRVVIWGTSIVPVDLNDIDVSFLVVHASRDGLRKKFITPKKLASMRSKLPPEGKAETVVSTHTVYHMIEGGNHAGFAHYGPQKLDKERSILLEEQQRLCVQVTTAFLRKNERKKIQ